MKQLSMTAKTVAFTAAFTALVYATTLISIPNGLGGNLNFGDPFILLCAALTNPLSAAFAGGVGAALADLTLSYAAYAPFTFVVKALVGLIAGMILLLLRRFRAVKKVYVPCATMSFIVAEMIMVAGYFGVNVLLNDGQIAPAVASVYWDLTQAAAAVAVAFVLRFALRLDIPFDKIYRRQRERTAVSEEKPAKTETTAIRDRGGIAENSDNKGDNK